MNFAKPVMALTFTLLMIGGPAVAQPADDPAQWSNRLHAALRLRPDQEQAWRSFQQASTPDAQEDARRQAAFERMGQMRSPQRMDLSIQMMRSDLQDMERRGDALKTFYGALSPDQQAVFDRETMRGPQ
jgi:protein CpxP